jgi:flagellar biosynthesis/type III secretory pathway protein FliH
VLRVSPDDFEMVQSTVSSINPAIRIEQANELERGDFMIDTRKTHLDGRMSSRIREIGRSLFEEE